MEEQHNVFLRRIPSPAKLVDFEVLLHVDQVLDLTTPPSSPSWQSFERETSGISDDSLDVEWPVKHKFVWRLGVSDRRRSPPRRVSVHERLGDRRRDRSPPGGGAGGQDRMHYPPPAWNAAAWNGAGGSADAGGSCFGKNGGGAHFSNQAAGAGAGVEEEGGILTGSAEGKGPGQQASIPEKEGDRSAYEEAALFCRSRESSSIDVEAWDPMADVANCQS
ncbi:hypothetical protein PVAP13_9NG134473 [Panicum virgatum]|uniref:Uncharacterized protein n=1 Tax=Panicum virgatum TaxID=38727 RepID=A0A8T0MGD7_PANVG|nr:hypothetical protein PVAP13_9NG134473 [Panicum virgatum]